MNKLKTDEQIVFELLRHPDKYLFWDVTPGLGNLHISYQHKHEKSIIEIFENMTDRCYSLGCIIPTKDTLGLGLIVLQKGFRNQ